MHGSLPLSSTFHMFFSKFPLEFFFLDLTHILLLLRIVFGFH